ncbi:alpha/beta hydrolase [Feifania hominis]|uniref:Lysophospholipase n=1 Tax=Feifania hominis TaxID=2763660 RepID=A0A926HUE9_9FIRM|nr:alpha/beta hydrolase [Feifania hominis]MBC8536839.1 lysophospholipase [Feifania hominis]
MTQTTNTLITSDGAKLYFKRFLPDGHPRALLCIVHGLGEHIDRYTRMAEFYTAQGFAVFGIDNRGHGRTQAPGGPGHAAPRRLVLDDVALELRTMKKEYPDLPVFLYGHSLGGNIVLSYRTLRGDMVDAYVVTSPWLILAQPLSKPKELGGRLLAKLKPAAPIETGLDAAGISTVRDEVEQYRRDPLVHGKISALTAMESLDLAKEMLARAGDIHSPILLIHGDSDPICSVEGSRLYAKNSGDWLRYVEFPGVRHEVHNDTSRETLYETVLAFLEEHIKK